MNGFLYLDKYAVSLAAATTNNLAITATRIEVTPQTDLDVITGLSNGGTEDTMIYLINVHATKRLVLSNNSGSSSTGNKIFVNNSADLTLNPGEIAMLGLSNGVGWFVFDHKSKTKQVAYTARTVNGTGYQVSTIADSEVRYSILLANGSLQTTTVKLEISPDNSTWTEAARVSNAVSLISATAIISCFVPRGYYIKLTTSGSGSGTFVCGQEVVG